MTAQILIADGDPLIRCHTYRYLTAHGYDVAVAADGLQCIEQLRANCPDLLVLDPEILHGDTAGVIEWLQKEQPIKPLKVVLADGHATKKLSKELRNLALARLERPACLADVCNFVGELESVLTCDGQKLPSPELRKDICETAGRCGK